VGGNARSAKLSGINAELVEFFVFVIMGSLAGLAGLVFAGYMNSALPQAGQLFELDAIAAVFIGGASMSGGIGTVIGAIVGGLVIGMVNNVSIVWLPGSFTRAAAFAVMIVLLLVKPEGIFSGRSTA